MRQNKYLNVVLTVNAALLSAVVWMQLAGGSLAPVAHAQSPTSDGNGIPNAGSQRQRMIEELQGLRTSVDAMRKQFDGGKMRVTVANIDEIRAATAPRDENNKDKDDVR